MFEALKKFNLNHYDFQSMIANVAILLRLLVINIDKRNTKKIPFICYILTITVTLSYIYVYFISVIWFTFWHCQETGDRISAIVVFSLGVASEIAAYKLLFMYIYSDTIKNIVENYISLDASVVANSRVASNLHSNLKTIKKRAMIFWCIIIGNGLLYISKAIILPGRHLMDDNFILFGLEPILQSPNFEIAFTVCVLGIFFTCYVTANINVFLIVITGYTEAQLLALSEELANIWSDAKKRISRKLSRNVNLSDGSENLYAKEEKELINKHINDRLILIIKIHTMNINLIKQIEMVFSGVICIEFLLVVIGLIAELLGGLENTYLELPFALIQVSMDCITGQRLIDACEVFRHALYECKWENFSAKNAKLVLLMLRSSQKTLCLSAGGITTLSFVCLMSVLRSIYSAYTTLRSTLNK